MPRRTKGLLLVKLMNAATKLEKTMPTRIALQSNCQIERQLRSIRRMQSAYTKFSFAHGNRYHGYLYADGVWL